MERARRVNGACTEHEWSVHGSCTEHTQSAGFLHLQLPQLIVGKGGVLRKKHDRREEIGVGGLYSMTDKLG